MFYVDPAWAGRIQFHELLFGTWSVYIVLVLIWERVLRAPLDEWRYVLLNTVGAATFCINHYFQLAPWWNALIFGYTAVFVAAWWLLGIRQWRRSASWKFAAFLMAGVYTGAYVALELSSRLLMDRTGLHEVGVMILSFVGFVGVIVWRGSNPHTLR